MRMVGMARATAIGVALAAVLWPTPAVTEAPAILWLAPVGKPNASSTAFATAVG